MPAAAQLPEERALESFRLFLSLKSREHGYAPSLHRHFAETLNAARQILERPDRVSRETSAEAVTLAVQFAKDGQLKSVFDKIDLSQGPTKEQASSALQAMEKSIADSCQPAHLAARVYTVGGEYVL